MDSRPPWSSKFTPIKPIEGGLGHEIRDLPPRKPPVPPARVPESNSNKAPPDKVRESHSRKPPSVSHSRTSHSSHTKSKSKRSLKKRPHHHKKVKAEEPDDNKPRFPLNPYVHHQFMGLAQPRDSEITIRAPEKAHTKVKHVVHRMQDANRGEGDEVRETESMNPFGDDEHRPNQRRASGHNYDIHKMIYAPKPKKVDKLVEKGTGRGVDFVFLVANFFTLILALYLVMLGLTILSFTSSIQSVLGEDNKNPAAILHTSHRSAPATVALVLIFGAVIHILNVFLGIYAAVQGFKNMLILHAVLSVTFFLTGTAYTVLITKDALCNKYEIGLVQDKMLEFIRLYGTPAPKDEHEHDKYEISLYHLDSLQLGLSCCGALSWSDYLNPLILHDGNENHTLRKTNLNAEDTVFPSSCCRPWWVRNVHCSKGAHLWAHPSVDNKTAFKFRQRINQSGCMWKLSLGCDRILYMIKSGMWIYIGIDLILIIVRFVCIYTIEKVIWQIIKKKKEFIASDLGHTEVMDDVEEETADGFILLPTEDEIEIIKARTEFNQFEARVNRTQVGKWIKDARKSVYLSLEKNQRTSQLDEIVPKDVVMSDQALTDKDEEHFLDAEQVLKLEIQKQKRIQRERKRRERHHTEASSKGAATLEVPQTRHGHKEKKPRNGSHHSHK